MKHFLCGIFRFSLLLIIPIIIVIALYFHFDPFKVVKNYSDYSFSVTIANRDYISTTMFLKNYKKYHYNSFIFGSSRAGGFKPGSWSKYLPESSVPYMFDAQNESIYGIYTKIKYLDSLKIQLKNVLIILDRDATFSHSENPSEHLFIKHPATSRESELTFQLTFIKAYLDPQFLLCFYAYKIIGYKEFMRGYIENNKTVIDTITNQLNFPDIELELAQNPSQYYLKNKDVFYARRGERVDSINQINEKQIFMLEEVKRILDKNQTNYKLVVSPTYDQVKFSDMDMNILRNLFSDNLFDFSGKNQFTDSINNYYEASHYRPTVGDAILSLIYN